MDVPLDQNIIALIEDAIGPVPPRRRSRRELEARDLAFTDSAERVFILCTNLIVLQRAVDIDILEGNPQVEPKIIKPKIIGD